jgi:hypothetical protein
MAYQKTYLYPWFGALGLAVVTAGIGFAIGNSEPEPVAAAEPAASALTAAAVFAVSPTQEELTKVIGTLVQESALTRKNPETEQAAEILATQLSEGELKFLQDKILNPLNKSAEREAALYILTLSPSPHAALSLIQVAGSPLPELPDLTDPHSAGSLQRTQELGLRVTALESLDQRAASVPSVVVGLNQILQKQTEPSLRFLAQTSLSGIEAGKPGRLKRVIEEMLGSTKQ